MAMTVDSSGGGDWDMFGSMRLGFELDTEQGIREWQCLVLNMVLLRIEV